MCFSKTWCIYICVYIYMHIYICIQTPGLYDYIAQLYCGWWFQRAYLARRILLDSPKDEGRSRAGSRRGLCRLCVDGMLGQPRSNDGAFGSKNGQNTAKGRNKCRIYFDDSPIQPQFYRGFFHLTKKNNAIKT